ncbi:MAG: hypothetical protein GXP55_04855 [Deltaproteobacteria bacterium]|nr:hypothetical protein [Deltaproteobacteria bacterium]
MTSPYREGGAGAPFGPADDDGLVSEIARQFTDPMAFYRELVQNALDAGTSSIRVSLSHDEEDGGQLQVRVRDDGCGMNRETLEDQLLVLFRSSKEGRTDAIGKFGIGFISVLAVNPEVVQVITSKGDGMSYRASLFPDHSWEVSESPGGAESGTTVTLHVPMARDALDEFAERSVRALRLWCKHSAAPIFFSASASGEVLREQERIDEPLSIESVFQLKETVGDTVMAVGLPGRAELRAEFYNRGLLLRALREAEVEPLMRALRVSFAVQDPALEHTLSREDVRRDDAFARVVASVSSLVRRRLAGAALDELARLARQRPKGWRQRYGKLLFALDGSRLRFDATQLRIPSIAADGSEQVALADMLLGMDGVYVADGEPEVHAALAARGHALIDPNACGHGVVPRRPWIQFLRRRLKLDDLGYASEQTLVEEREASASDRALAEALVRSLAGSPRAVRGVGFAMLVGAPSEQLHVVAKLGAGRQIVDSDKLTAWPRFRLRRPTLLLSVEHPLVNAARTSRDAELGASCLTRVILGRAEAIDREREFALTQRALKRILRAR